MMRLPLRPLLPAGMLLVVAVACAPTEPPGGASGSVSSAVPSAIAGSPVVSVSGSTVHVVGTGNATTPSFDLPAGSAQIKISPCSSNQVVPFVTLYDASGTSLGLIVDPTYAVKNLAGGRYTFGVVANPSCSWTIEVTPG